MFRLRSLVLTLWPAFCALVVGGLLGGLTHSRAIGVLFGAVAWVCFADLMHNGDPSSASDEDDGYDPERLINPWEVPTPGDLQQIATLHAYGAVGRGIFAKQYQHPESE